MVEEEGARVFLGPLAADQLRGRVLDARDDSEGRIWFVVRPPAWALQVDAVEAAAPTLVA